MNAFWIWCGSKGTSGKYEEEEKIGEEQEMLHQALRDGVMDLQAALVAFRKVMCLTEELKTIQSADALAEDYAWVNNIGASILSVNIVELRGKQPMLKRRHN